LASFLLKFLEPGHGENLKESCVILLVEDDPNDAFFVARALKELGFNGTLQHLTDSNSARAYLAGEAPYRDREQFPLPDLVVADSALPARGSGVDLAEWMGLQPASAATPFVILSGDVSPEVSERAKAAGVKRILLKGSNYQDTCRSLREVLRELPAECREWLKP
jgi:CheY-like chemotaxis protein